MNLICKLFNFILALFVTVVEGVAYALKTVGEVAFDLLSSVLDSMGKVFGIDGTTLAWLGGGLLLFFMLRKKERKEEGGDHEQRNSERASDQQVVSQA